MALTSHIAGQFGNDSNVSEWPKLSRLFSRLHQMRLLSRQRRQLGRLSDEALKDIGVGRNIANLEANRNAWDVPGTWRN